MSPLVHQVGELFLRAVPVAVLVLLFYFLMRSLFFGPLLKVMAERDARTQGAQKAAEAAQAAAIEKEARSKADAEVNAAKERVAAEFAGAKKEIESTAAQLAAEIARRVLQTPTAPGTPGREAR